MFSAFKKWRNRCRLPHEKAAGQPYPENLKQIFRFSPYLTDTFGYGIHECSGCGKRLFSCCGYHMMGTNMERTIDAFIAHDITRDDFVGFLEKEMKWYKETKPTDGKGIG